MAPRPHASNQAQSRLEVTRHRFIPIIEDRRPRPPHMSCCQSPRGRVLKLRTFFTNFYFTFSRDTNARFHSLRAPIESTQDTASDMVR